VCDGQTLVDTAERLKPDLILTDISMPSLNGIDAADRIRRMGCNAKVIFLTVHSDPDFVRACLGIGAFGYVVKERIALDLLTAIYEVLGGHLFISPLTRTTAKRTLDAKSHPL